MSGFVIGDIALKYGLMLAPMAGYSDRAMRLVAKMHGSEYLVSEMVSAKAIAYGDRKTAVLARIEEDELPSALQLFGSEPEVLAEAAERVTLGEFGGAVPSVIDINMGCPVAKVFKNGEGSALMKNPSIIEKICSAVTKRINKPLSVKLRLGVDREHINAYECALAAEAGGAALIAVHGRTRADMYMGEASYSEIARIKAGVKVPVVANGDITSAEVAIAVLRETGADGLMIGRGAVGNPFIFEEIIAALDGAEYKAPSILQRRDTALLQLRLAIANKGEEIAVREARGQIAQYMRSFRGAAALRAAINRAEGYEEVVRAFDEVVLENEDNARGLAE